MSKYEAAQGRVARYLVELACMPLLHQQEIHCLNIGSERETCLFASDLRLLASAPVAAPTDLHAAIQRMGDGDHA